MNTVNKLDTMYETSFKFKNDDEKFNKTKSLFNKTYNEKIFLDNETIQKNNSQIYDKGRKKFQKESIIPDIGKDYIENEEYFRINEEKEECLPTNFLDKLRGSTVKVNLNISNNYYNSNYNIYREKIYKTKCGQSQKQKEILDEDLSKKSGQTNNEENVTTRLTVFIKKVFFGNESGKKGAERNSNIKKASQNIKPLITSGENQELLYVPCQNCNTLIKIEEIDSHSNVCVKVKLEVYQSEIENKDDAVNYKLKKLQENIIKIKSNPNFEMNKESYYIHSLIQTITQALKIENVTGANMELLNKLSVNIQALLVKFKGSIATQVLLERAKILIKEKIKEHKKVLRSSDKDACDVKQRLTQLKKAKDEKLHEAKRLTIEKEFIQNKIKNLNSFPREITKNRQGTNLKPRNFKFLQAQLQKDDNDDEIEVENEIEYEQLQPRNSRWSDFSQHPRLIIDDINSDVEDERTSQFSYNTERSSIYTSNKSYLDKLDTSLNLTIDDNECQSQEMKISVPSKPDPKEMKNLYREFVKLVLKVKFEVFNGNHPGQKISERILFNECLSKQISRNQFREFIINELNQPEKYLKCFKSVTKARKTKLPNKNLMEVICEESF